MRKGLKGLLVLMVAGLALFVFATNVLLANSITLTRPVQFQNVTGTLYFNATVNANGTHANHIVNVTFRLQHINGTFYYDQNLSNTTANQTSFNTTFNTVTVPDGWYNVTVIMFNITGGLTNTDGIITNASTNTNNLTLDHTSPNVSIFNLTGTTSLNIQFGRNFTVETGNRTFQATVFDFKHNNLTGFGSADVGVFKVDSVYFWFDNGTGSDFNLTGVNTSGVWTVIYNVSSLSGENAAQTVRVVANDTLGNINNTHFFNFTVDRTNPKVTVTASSITSTAAKISASTNETVNNCTYSVTNGGGSGTFASSGTSYSADLTLLPSNDYTASVTCGDFAGNQGTGAKSFTSSAAASTSNGGGGAGGSSGGASTGVQGQYEKKVWSSINAGETASVTLKNGAVGVTEVSLSVPQTVYGAWISVTKRDTLPSSVSAFEGKVYRNVDINKGPALAKEGAFTDATIKFKVEKVWLAEQQLTKEAVALHHYANGAWVELATTVGEDDGTYVHYSAKTPGFSYFVIGEKSGAAAAPTEAAPVEAPAEEAAEEAAAAEEPAMEKKGLSKGLLLALLAAAVVVAAVVLYMRKKR